MTSLTRRSRMNCHSLGGVAALLMIMASSSYAAPAEEINSKPPFISGAIEHKRYYVAGQEPACPEDDLLTAGLGKSGLEHKIPPADPPVDDPPTPAQLRRFAIYNNYRALVDVKQEGGFGRLYGPNIDIHGNYTPSEGKICGDEYLAFSDDGSGTQNVTLMVQIPTTFDANYPCITTAPSSGSRGIYGAISLAEWGLKRGCAVAYTDKGTGTGFHDVQGHTVNLINGVRQAASEAGKASNFTAHLSDAQRSKFNKANPHRFAVKHAHSVQNPEKDWGKHTLQAIEFAFFLLNEQFGQTSENGRRLRKLRAENTMVIAAGVSNGGGAALAAAEQDGHGLIDGVVTAEPQVQPRRYPPLKIKRGSTYIKGHSKPLLDYFTLANLYQPCAAIAEANPLKLTGDIADRAANRCQALKEKGLLKSGDPAGQAEEALDLLKSHGWEQESDVLHPFYYLAATRAVAITFANSYGRFSVADNVCGFSFGATDAEGKPTPANQDLLAKIFGTSPGLPPAPGINIINKRSTALNSAPTPVEDLRSFSAPKGRQDLNVDGALCLRRLAIGRDPATGKGLTDKERDDANRVQSGMAKVRRNGNLQGKPAIIVHGRSDALVPVNHTSRRYFGLNKFREGQRSRLAYYEVTNGQHFDAFIASVTGYDRRLVPLHWYVIQAMDLMYNHLKSGNPLPPSQLVRTSPRGVGPDGKVPKLKKEVHLPPISPSPKESDRIVFERRTVQVPD
jgi:hydroxybutyrate-dimer hydrolase